MVIKIGIVGTRSRNSEDDYWKVHDEFNLLRRVIEGHGENVVIISGGCSRGADRFAEIISSRYSIPIKIHRADWKQGLGAGFMRNSIIAGESDALIACVSRVRRGGTEDCIRKFIDNKKSCENLHVV
jgi:hypothetical protein